MGHRRSMGGEVVTTALREQFAAELAKKVSQRGVVLWQDTDHENPKQVRVQ